MTEGLSWGKELLLTRDNIATPPPNTGALHWWVAVNWTHTSTNTKTNTNTKNYFSQEIISPLLLLLTYTLLLFTAELQSNTNTTWYYQAGTVEVWYTWYTVSHSHLVESGTLGTLSIHYTVVHPVVHLVLLVHQVVLLVHQVVHLVHLVQTGEWEWQIRDLTAAAAPWDLWGIAPPAFIFQMTILKLNFLSMVFFVQN